MASIHLKFLNKIHNTGSNSDLFFVVVVVFIYQVELICQILNPRDIITPDIRLKNEYFAMDFFVV